MAWWWNDNEDEDHDDEEDDENDEKDDDNNCNDKDIDFFKNLFKGSIVISPGYAIMLGGDNLFVSGPCFKSSDDIICKFSGGKAINGSFISPIQASCTVPMLYSTGRLTIKMSVNGGRSFDYQGIITIGKIRLWKVVGKPSLSHCIKDYFAKALSLLVEPGVAGG